MKPIMLSVKPKWAKKIFNNEKTIEVRKKFPINYRGYIEVYCSSPVKKVIGYFDCYEVKKIEFHNGEYLVDGYTIYEESCLSKKEMHKYLNGKNGYAICILPSVNIKEYRNPFDLSYFGIKTAPQNYCYIKGENK